MTALVDLLKGEHTSAEVLDTFKEYAQSGAGISYLTLKEIVDTVRLGPEQLDTAYEYMQEGLTFQISGGNAIDGLEYLRAMNYLARQIASTPAKDALKVISEEPLVVLKSELIQAHTHQLLGTLKRAVSVFQRYVLQLNPADFGQGQVSLSFKGGLDLFKKSYNLARFGGSIPVHSYLMGIHATSDFDIVEKSSG